MNSRVAPEVIWGPLTSPAEPCRVGVGVPLGAERVALFDDVVEPSLRSARLNTAWTSMLVSSAVMSAIHLREITSQITVVGPGSRPMRRVVDPYPVRGLLDPHRPRPADRARVPLRTAKAQVAAL